MKSMLSIHNALIKWFIVPGILLFFWLVASVFFNSYSPFHTLTYEYALQLPQNNNGLLLQGQKIYETFRANENNLGIIAVSLSNREPVNSDDQDQILFSLTDTTTKREVYNHTYFINSIREGDFLVFGFPKITNSKNNVYQFAITSQKGDPSNAIITRYGASSFLAKYIFTGNDLPNKKAFLEFVLKRIKMLFTTKEAFLTSTIFFLPFLFYVTLISFSKFLKSKLGGLTLSFMALSSLFSLTAYSGIVLGLLGLWIIAIVKDKVNYKYTLYAAMVSLFLAGISALFRRESLVDTTSLWGYLLLCTGFVQILMRYRK